MQFSYTLLLIIVTCAVSFIAYERKDLFYQLSFRPYNIKRNPREMYRVISHAFVHADLIHLFFNMWVLYMFGRLLEQQFAYDFGMKGLYIYSLLYFGGIIFATLPGFAKHKDNFAYTSIGASGATSALVFSFIVLAPTQSIHFFFLPGIPAFVFGIIYLAAEYYMSRRGNTNIAHDAHIFGGIYGFIFTMLINLDYAKNFWNKITTFL
jgi:membrane associated rhomboid family serine protease